MRVSRVLRASGEIEDQHFAAVPLERERALVAERRAVALAEPLAVHGDGAARDVDPGVSPGPYRELGLLAFVEHARVERDVLVQGHGPVASVLRPDEAQLPAPLGLGEGLLLVAGRVA